VAPFFGLLNLFVVSAMVRGRVQVRHGADLEPNTEYFGKVQVLRSSDDELSSATTEHSDGPFKFRHKNVANDNGLCDRCDRGYGHMLASITIFIPGM